MRTKRSMPHRSMILLIIGIAMATLSSRAAADLTVESWSLSVGIQNYDLGQPSPSAYFQVVQNPFQGSHAVTVGTSFANAAYDFEWSGDFAHFDAYTNHHLEQLVGSTISEGRIFVTPAVDTLVTLVGAWQFSWPSATIGASNMAMRVYNANTFQILIGTGAAGGNTGLGPPYGDYHFQNSGLLLAGEPYMIYYVARIVHDNPTPTGTHGEGSGEIHFSLTPVPEPATLALIVFAVLIPRRRGIEKPAAAISSIRHSHYPFWLPHSFAIHPPT